MKSETQTAQTSSPSPSGGRALTSATLLDHLLASAQRYHREHNDRQAAELFWTLVEEHPLTAQAETAKAELMLIAEGYERKGKKHTARSMYERLLDLEA